MIRNLSYLIFPVENENHCDLSDLIFPVENENHCDLSYVIFPVENENHCDLSYLIFPVENENHCDFVKLREMLIRTNMQDLIDTTHFRHYELFRRTKLQEMGFSDSESMR